MDVAAGGAGGLAPDLRSPELFGDEVDNALLGLEGPRDAEKRSRLGEETAYRANQSVRQMADLSASRHIANLLPISFRIVVFQA